MDGERAQARAALVAMRRQIRAKQMEIVLFQYAKEGEQAKGKEAESGGRTRRDAARLRRSFRKTERRLRAQVEAGSGTLDDRDVDLAGERVALQPDLPAVWLRVRHRPLGGDCDRPGAEAGEAHAGRRRATAGSGQSLSP